MNISISGQSTLAATVSINALDFGVDGSNEASIVITGVSGILSTSKIDAWIQYEPYGAGTSHTAQDQSYGAALIQLSCGNIVPGVGFTIYGRSLENIAGKFSVHWAWG